MWWCLLCTTREIQRFGVTRFVPHIKGKSWDEAFDDKPLEVRQSHSSEEAPEQAGLTLRVERVERRGLTKRKRSQQKIGRDSEHGKFSFRLERLGKAAKSASPYFIQHFHLWLDVGAVCVSSARTDLCRRPVLCWINQCKSGLYGDCYKYNASA